MASLFKEISVLAEVAMNTAELMKPAGGGENQGVPRIDIVLQRVKNGEDFELNTGGRVIIDAVRTKPVLDALRTHDQETIDKALKDGTASYKPVIYTRDGAALPITAFKKAQYFGGAMSGAGGGAERTELRESAQAMVCALAAAKGGDLDIEDLEPNKLITAPDSQYDVTATERAMIEFLRAPSEANSALLIANETIEVLHPGQNFVWHRGSAWVKSLEKQFNKVNKNEGRFFVNINKWSPADIWCVQRGIEVPTDLENFDQLNGWVNKMFHDRKVYGISLKLVAKRAKIEVINDSYGEGNLISHIVKRLIVSKRNQLFGSKDAHIVFESEALDLTNVLTEAKPEREVQYRSFGGDDPIQGQITGKTAAHGKIGHGPTNKFLERAGMQTLTPRVDVLRKIKSKEADPKQKYMGVVRQIINMASVVDPAFRTAYKPKDLAEIYKDMSPAFVVSKFQAVELMMILSKATKEQRVKFINNIVGYAGSATELSATYAKATEG